MAITLGTIHSSNWVSTGTLSPCLGAWDLGDEGDIVSRSIVCTRDGKSVRETWGSGVRRWFSSVFFSVLDSKKLVTYPKRKCFNFL